MPEEAIPHVILAVLLESKDSAESKDHLALALQHFRHHEQLQEQLELIRRRFITKSEG
jgi:hypothetical protein